MSCPLCCQDTKGARIYMRIGEPAVWIEACEEHATKLILAA